MVDFNLADWKERLPILMGDSAPTIPNLPAGKASRWKNILTPAAQGGGLERLAIGLDLFGQGMGGKPFGATQMAQSSLANLAEQKRQGSQEKIMNQLISMISGGPTPKGKSGINKMTSSMDPSGSRKIAFDMDLDDATDGEGRIKEFPLF